MSSASLIDSTPRIPYHDAIIRSPEHTSTTKNNGGLIQGVARRWRRERRRRKVGRAYDMALEIARMIPSSSTILDVGCGNGYIAHHLSAILGAHVLGIDLNQTTEAAIDFKRFDGRHFPARDQSIDAALFCYVLHHAQDLGAILSELRRVLRDHGSVLVYEDIPASPWDRVVCGIHNLKWRKRTGPCTFRQASDWRVEFSAAGFEIVSQRKLGRTRNLVHPVSRRLFLLKVRK